MRNRRGEPCLVYGATVLSTAVIASLLAITQPGADMIDGGIAYGLTSLFMTSSLFIFRSGKYGRDTTLDLHEISAATLSAFGFAPLVALIGLLLSGISGDYKDAGDWTPEGLGAEQEIKRLVTVLEMSEKVEERAMTLLGTLRDQELMKNRPVPQMAGAIIYIAGREHKEPRSLEEISANIGSTQKDVGKAYRFIGRNTDIQIRPPEPEDYILRFTEKLGLSVKVRKQAGKLVEDAGNQNIFSGKSPTGLAATAIYLAAYMEGEKRSMREVSDILDVTTITLRERSKDFISVLGLENVPEHLLEDTDDE